MSRRKIELTGLDDAEAVAAEPYLIAESDDRVSHPPAPVAEFVPGGEACAVLELLPSDDMAGGRARPPRDRRRADGPPEGESPADPPVSPR